MYFDADELNAQARTCLVPSEIVLIQFIEETCQCFTLPLAS